MKSKKLFLIFIFGLFIFFLFPNFAEADCMIRCYNAYCPWCTDVYSCCWDHKTGFGENRVGIVNLIYCTTWESRTEQSPCVCNTSGGIGYEPGRQGCKVGGFPTVSTANGMQCGLLNAHFQFPGCVVCSKYGVYDESEVKCVQCDSNNKEIKILGTSSTLYGDPCGSYGTSGDNLCESACGASSTCDEHSPGYTCEIGKTCNSSCQCVAIECNSCSVSSMSCPSSVNTGQSFNISFQYYGTGSTIYPYEHRSLWRETTRIDCKYGNATQCVYNSDSFSTTAPTTPGTYTYYVKCYGASSQSTTYCNSADSSQSCTVKVCECTSTTIGGCCDGCNYCSAGKVFNGTSCVDATATVKCASTVNKCTAGQCSGEKRYPECQAGGVCDSSATIYYASDPVYASAGYTLTSTCGTTGTSYCTTNQCRDGDGWHHKCSKRCDSAHNCTYWINASCVDHCTNGVKDCDETGVDSGGSCPVTCTCTAWSNVGCGVSPCLSTQMKQTRTCTPAGCNIESQCVDDLTCVTPGFDFSISINPTSGSVAQSGSIAATVATTLTSGTTQSVNFYILSGLPSGASASFNPPSCNPDCSSTMTINTSATTPAGSYSIYACGTSGDKTHCVTYGLAVVETPNNPPTCIYLNVSPTSGNPPLAVSFIGSGSDPDGTIVQYEFDFGDGSPKVYSSTSGSSYTYNAAGTYTAALRVQDNDGAWSSTSFVCTKTITVTEAGAVITPPLVITNGADPVEITSATLNGTLIDLGYDPADCPSCSSIVWFEWGPTPFYGNSTPVQTMTSPGNFSYPITNLDDNATYYFEAFAKNGGTPPIPPPPPSPWTFSNVQCWVSASGVGTWQQVNFTATVTNAGSSSATRTVTQYRTDYQWMWSDETMSWYREWSSPRAVKSVTITLAPGQSYNYHSPEKNLIAHDQPAKCWLEDSEGFKSTTCTVTAYY